MRKKTLSGKLNHLGQFISISFKRKPIFDTGRYLKLSDREEIRNDINSHVI